MDLMPHNPLGPISTAAHVHFCAAVPNFSWLESREGEGENQFTSELFKSAITLDGTGYPVPTGPGLGPACARGRSRRGGRR